MKKIPINLGVILRNITRIEEALNIYCKYCFVFNFRQVRSQFIRCSEEDRDRTFVRVANKKYKYILYFEQTGDDRAAGIVAFSHCDRPRD